MIVSQFFIESDICPFLDDHLFEYVDLRDGAQPVLDTANKLFMRLRACRATKIFRDPRFSHSRHQAGLQERRRQLMNYWKQMKQPDPFVLSTRRPGGVIIMDLRILHPKRAIMIQLMIEQHSIDQTKKYGRRKTYRQRNLHKIKQIMHIST
jgi:hypothetical protein